MSLLVKTIVRPKKEREEDGGEKMRSAVGGKEQVAEARPEQKA
jgi:hypothetical protein